MHKIDRKGKYNHNVMDYMHHLHEYNIDSECNHIYLMGEEYPHSDSEPDQEPGVEYRMANRFLRNINFLMRKNSSDPILIHMKTCGGYWTEGMAIYDAIRSCPNPVTILNYSHARSMSSIIMQAANKRVMMPHSYFMFHEGSDGFGGTYKQFQSYANFSKTVDTAMLDIYCNALKNFGKSKYKKWSEKRIREMLQNHMDKKEDVYLTAKEACEWGFADSIFGSDGKYDWGSLTAYTDEELSR